MENLFLDPVYDESEKTAAEVTLPEDATTWPNEILQELFKQIPYIADFDPHIVMDRVDAEKGYGFGHIEIGNKTEMARSTPATSQAAAGVHKVRIPIIVSRLKLQPFDVLVTEDSKMMPLTESRIRQALFRPQPFDITSQTPGDMSMIGQLYPPYRQNYGFGGSGASTSVGMGKEGSSSLLSSVLQSASREDLEKFALQIAEDENLQAALFSNRMTAPSLAKIASASLETTEKAASAIPHFIRPTVVQLLKDSEGYAVKVANHSIWAPTTEVIDRGEAVRRFGSKTVLAADLSGSVTAADTDGVDAIENEEEEPQHLVKEFGIYKVYDVEGNELVGFVFPNLIDLDGTSLPLALFTNGSQAAVQGEIMGTPAGQAEMMALPTGHPRGYGAFYRMGTHGPEATIPFELQASLDSEEGVVMMGTSFDGSPVKVLFNQPNIEQVTSEGEHVLIPEDFQWLPLNKEDSVALAAKPEEIGPQESAVKQAFATVTIRGGYDCFSFEGPAVEKLAADQRQELHLAEALFLLSGLGVEHQYGQKKLAEAMTGDHPINIRVGRFIKTAGDVRQDMIKAAHAALEKLPSWKVNLVKEAAAIPDPTIVDTVLSLGFLNSESLSHFIGYRTSINTAQEQMCEMLVASRLGLREIPTGSLERAIKAVEEVLEGLKVMAFRQN